MKTENEELIDRFVKAVQSCMHFLSKEKAENFADIRKEILERMGDGHEVSYEYETVKPGIYRMKNVNPEPMLDGLQILRSLAHAAETVSVCGDCGMEMTENPVALFYDGKMFCRHDGSPKVFEDEKLDPECKNCGKTLPEVSDRWICGFDFPVILCDICYFDREAGRHEHYR